MCLRTLYLIFVTLGVSATLLWGLGTYLEYLSSRRFPKTAHGLTVQAADFQLSRGGTWSSPFLRRDAVFLTAWRSYQFLTCKILLSGPTYFSFPWPANGRDDLQLGRHASILQWPRSKSWLLYTYFVEHIWKCGMGSEIIIGYCSFKHVIGILRQSTDKAICFPVVAFITF